MSSVTQTLYMTKMIRAGFEAADVNLWQSLLQQAKTDIGDSHHYLFLLLDMARHNKCDVLEVVKTGRVCSGQKSVNEKFIDSLLNCVASPKDEVGDASTGVLDLTADEELSDSASYEETSEPYNDNPNSAEAYEIDGFVVEDHVSQPEDDDDIVDKMDGLKKKPKKRLLKRKLSLIPEE